jgi:hypothetical protein
MFILRDTIGTLNERRYFEVRVDEASSSSFVTIGLCPADYPLFEVQPGWMFGSALDLLSFDARRSVGYHGDDGRIVSNNIALTTLATFDVGDVVGCGLTTDNKVFFSRNGAVVAELVVAGATNLHPAFGGKGTSTTSVQLTAPFPLAVF